MSNKQILEDCITDPDSWDLKGELIIPAQQTQQEEEQHCHFVINDFADLVKKYGAGKVYAWMDDATCFELWRVFLRGR